MAAKVSPINQHDYLHPYYGQNNCCLCFAERRIKELEEEIHQLKQPKPIEGIEELKDKIYNTFCGFVCGCLPSFDACGTCHYLTKLCECKSAEDFTNKLIPLLSALIQKERDRADVQWVKAFLKAGWMVYNNPESVAGIVKQIDDRAREEIINQIQQAIDEQSYPDDTEQWIKFTMPKTWWESLKSKRGGE